MLLLLLRLLLLLLLLLVLLLLLLLLLLMLLLFFALRHPSVEKQESNIFPHSSNISPIDPPPNNFLAALPDTFSF